MNIPGILSSRPFLLFIMAPFYFTLAFSQVSLDSNKQDILQALTDQQSCWNKGDLNCFMEGYWQSDSLRFMSKDGITYGWQNILSRYQKKYTTPEIMGKLSFKILSLEEVGNADYIVLGKWQIDHGDEMVKGYFSLLWKKINDRWVIVFDHTS